MEVVERSVANKLESMDMLSVADGVDISKIPRQDTMRLQRQRQSLTMTVPKPVWKQTNHTLESPGEVDILYWSNGLMLVDTSGVLDKNDED